MGTLKMTFQHWSIVLAAILFLGLGDANGARPLCGDNKCSGKETAASCPQDCTAGDICGDGSCTGPESCESCSQDCGTCVPQTCNNDGICNLEEDCFGCPGDCAGQTSGKRKDRFCCGDDTCDSGLCGANCGAVTPICGDGALHNGEACDDGNLTNGDGCSDLCEIEISTPLTPTNQFNIGDSFGEAEAANGSIGSSHHDTVWSTGFDGGDIVQSLNERFESGDPSRYYENDNTRDAIFNRAVSGANMVDFATQAQEVVTEAGLTPTQEAGMVTILLGSNDVCADSLDDMLDPTVFEAQYRAGLDVLWQSQRTASANIHVSSLPAIYWLWAAKRDDLYCRLFAWPFVPCQNLLDNSADDCESSDSRRDPDTIYSGDGSNCVRRKQFHAEIRDVYNPILRDVLEEYRTDGKLPYSEYVDIFDVSFNSSYVNDGDCFHPSIEGHSVLAEKHWCRSQWGAGDSLCSP
jgi:cysteine-rich repeat protein